MPFKQQIQCKIASITRKKTRVGRTWCQHWPSIKWVLYKLRLELWCSELRQKDLKKSINNDTVIVWYQCSTTNRWLDASSTLIITPSFFGRAWGRASSVLSFHSCIRRRHGNQKVKTNGTTTGGSKIFPRERSAHVPCCQNVVQPSSTTSEQVLRSSENSCGPAKVKCSTV